MFKLILHVATVSCDSVIPFNSHQGEPRDWCLSVLIDRD